MRQLVLESQNSQKLCNLILSLPFLAENIVSLVDHYLRQRYTYLKENVETLLTPDYMLTSLENSGRVSGDCDDISVLQAAIYKCLGFRVRFVAIRSDPNDDNYDHVFVEVNDGFGWIIYDLTLPIGFKIEYLSKVTIEV